MYSYNAYNQNITSQIKLPLKSLTNEGFKTNKKIQLHLGSIPNNIIGDKFLGSTSYFIENDTIYVDAPSIARYFVKNKSDVVVEPYLDSDETLIGLFFVHLVMVFIVKEKDQLLFHGSALTLPASSASCILLGSKGAGKSTLAAALTKLGCKVLCDDLIQVIQGPVVQPGIPIIKLFKDSYKAITKKEDVENVQFDGQGKIHVQVNHTIQPSSLRTICIIEKKDISKIEIKEITGGQKLQNIIPHIIKISQIDTDVSVFRQLLTYSNSIRVFHLIRPEGFTDPHFTANIILKKITEGEIVI
ncbi:MAG: hypothetical protein WC162_02065 [Sphaerochaetaceae bacterium]|nr:hypothetical protein [Sphaerochaetaceae bacterium]